MHSATGLIVRFILGAVLDAHEQGTTPELQLVDELRSWCSAPGDETMWMWNNAVTHARCV